MIPKKIHQCWVGPSPIPERHRAWMDGIRAMMPDFEYRLWGNADLPDNRFVRECLKWKKYALLSDWMRWRVLWDEGGFYMDTDVEVHKSFEPLLAHRGVLGFDGDNLRKKPVSNAIIGAEPRLPFIGACIEAFEKALNRHLKPPYGVKVGNLVLLDWGMSSCGAQRLGDLKLLSKETLYGEYTCHHLEGSWHSKKDFRAKMRSVVYRSGRAAVLARGLLTGKQMYPGEPVWPGEMAGTDRGGGKVP